MVCFIGMSSYRIQSRIQYTAKNDKESYNIEPDHQHDYTSKASINGRVISNMIDIVGKAPRRNMPNDRSEESPRQYTFESYPLIGRKVVDTRKHPYHDAEAENPTGNVPKREKYRR